MSRTDLDHATLANALRSMAGDGSMEWVTEPVQASVLLDAADMLDETTKLRELVQDMWDFYCAELGETHVFEDELDFSAEVWKRMRELEIEVS